jgi:hypothetical protein
MKQFFKDIQTKLKDFWQAYDGPKDFEQGFNILCIFFFFGLWLGFSPVKIIILFISYTVYVFVRAVLIKRFPEIVLLIGKVLGWLFVLFIACFFLDFIGYGFFKMYLGYDYFSWINYFFYKTQ